MTKDCAQIYKVCIYENPKLKINLNLLKKGVTPPKE